MFTDAHPKLVLLCCSLCNGNRGFVERTFSHCLKKGGGRLGIGYMGNTWPGMSLPTLLGSLLPEYPEQCTSPCDASDQLHTIQSIVIISMTVATTGNYHVRNEMIVAPLIT